MNAIEQNEIQVNHLMMKLNKLLSFQSITLLVLNLTNVFQIPWNYFGIIFVLLPVLCWLPILYHKKSQNPKWFKYMQVLNVLLLATINYMFNHSYALVFWAVPIVMAALYFDSKLVKTTMFFSVPLFAIGHWFNVHFETIYYFTPDRLVMSFGSFVISILVLGVLVIGFTKKANEMLWTTKDLMDDMSLVLTQTDDAANEVSGLVDSVSSNIYKTHEHFKEITVEMDDISSQIQFFNERINVTHKAIDEMSQKLKVAMANVNKIGLEASTMSSLSNKSANSILESERRMNEVDGLTQVAREKLDLFHKRFNEISDATRLITHIASETSLLSLNASIEAARAGEAGRGFAIVANEVRKLAEDSEASVSSIEGVIDNLRKTVEEVVKAMDAMYGVIAFSASAMQETNETFGTLRVSQSNIEREIIAITEEINLLEQFSHNIQMDMVQLLDNNKIIRSSVETVKQNSTSVRGMSREIVNHIDDVSKQCDKLKAIDMQ